MATVILRGNSMVDVGLSMEKKSGFLMALRQAAPLYRRRVITGASAFFQPISRIIWVIAQR